MKTLGLLQLCLLISADFIHGVRIPDDIEILDGYTFDSQNILNPDSAFFGQGGSSGPRLFKAIRDKRNIGNDFLKNIEKSEKRSKRDVADDEEKTHDAVEKSTAEELPTPEKFVSNNFRDSHKSMEQWGKSPYMNEFSKIQKEEDDSQYIQADASTINEGIKTRAPRVNFITQQNKPDARERTLVPGSDLRDLYKIPNPNDRWTEPPSTRTYDQYQTGYNRDMLVTPPTPSYRYPYPEYYDERKSYDNYYDPVYGSRGYNSMYRDMLPRDRYDYYEPRYDGYYNNRDYWPLHSNDINDRGYPMMGNRNRRIIYYANLPDVARSPSYSDMNYNTYGSYYPYRDSYPMYDPYRSSRLVREREFMPKNSNSPRSMTPMPSPAMQKEMDPNKYSSVPLKISSSLRVENQRPDRRMFTEVTDTREGRPSFQDGIEDRKRSYLTRYN